MSTQHVEFRYPDDISSNHYTHRKIIFHVKNQRLFPRFEELKTEVSELESEAANYIVNNIEDLKKLLEEATKDNGAPECTITLPLPNEISDTQGHGWSTEKGIIGTVGAKYESMGIGGVNVSKFLGTTSDTLGTRKPLADPGYFQNYNGSEPRNFKMTFDFVPRNPEEAKSMMLIINTFKAYSSPKTFGFGIGILAPYFFDIEISNPYISSLIRLDNMVITEVTVNYAADGAMQFLPDGTPKHTQLSLSLTERRMKTFDDYTLST